MYTAAAEGASSSGFSKGWLAGGRWVGVSYVIARRQSFPAALRIVPRNRPDDAPSISFGPAKAWHNARTGCASPAVVVDTRPELRTGPRINVRIFFFANVLS